MNYNNKYDKAIRQQLGQERQAQFSLIVNANKLELPIDIQCNLFEKLVFPIILYGCETWGLNLMIFWKYFTGNYLKKILYLRPSTPSCMVYGEVDKLHSR